MAQEHWKIIPSSNGQYSVSNLGRVRSEYFERLNRPSKVISQRLNRENGYATVFFQGKRKYVHRLVAEAFIRPPLDKETVNHKDWDKTNNTPDNLEYMSMGDNIRDSFVNTPLRPRPLKVTNEDVHKIFHSHIVEQKSHRQIGQEFGVSRAYVWKIVTGNTSFDYDKHGLTPVSIT